MSKKLKLDMKKYGELHACGMVLLEILLEQKCKFTGEDCITIRLPVVLPDESKHTITIAILEQEA